MIGLGVRLRLHSLDHRRRLGLTDVERAHHGREDPGMSELHAARASCRLGYRLLGAEQRTGAA